MANPEQETVITDELIETLVGFIEAAELLGKSLDMPVSQAARIMFKSTQIMQQIAKSKNIDWSKLSSKKVM